MYSVRKHRIAPRILAQLGLAPQDLLDGSTVSVPPHVVDAVLADHMAGVHNDDDHTVPGTIVGAAVGTRTDTATHAAGELALRQMETYYMDGDRIDVCRRQAPVVEFVQAQPWQASSPRVRAVQAYDGGNNIQILFVRQ